MYTEPPAPPPPPEFEQAAPPFALALIEPLMVIVPLTESFTAPPPFPPPQPEFPLLPPPEPGRTGAVTESFGTPPAWAVVELPLSRPAVPPFPPCPPPAPPSYV